MVQTLFNGIFPILRRFHRLKRSLFKKFAASQSKIRLISGLKAKRRLITSINSTGKAEISRKEQFALILARERPILALLAVNRRELSIIRRLNTPRDNFLSRFMIITSFLPMKKFLANLTTKRNVKQSLTPIYASIPRNI